MWRIAITAHAQALHTRVVITTAAEAAGTAGRPLSVNYGTSQVQV